MSKRNSALMKRASLYLLSFDVPPRTCGRTTSRSRDLQCSYSQDSRNLDSYEGIFNFYYI